MDVHSREARAWIATLGVPLGLALAAVLFLLVSDGAPPKLFTVATFVAPIFVIPVGIAVGRRKVDGSRYGAYAVAIATTAVVGLIVAYYVLGRVVQVYCEGRYECPW